MYIKTQANIGWVYADTTTQHKMMNVNNLVLVLTISLGLCFGLAQSAIYPYALVDQCTLADMNLTDIVGRWHVFSSNQTALVNGTLTITALNATHVRALATNQGNKMVLKNEVLEQNPWNKGRLDRIVDKGTYTLGVPWFVLTLRPSRYMTVFHGSYEDDDEGATKGGADANNVDHWAVYTRDEDISPVTQVRASRGLRCSKLV